MHDKGKKEIERTCEIAIQNQIPANQFIMIIRDARQRKYSWESLTWFVPDWRRVSSRALPIDVGPTLDDVGVNRRWTRGPTAIVDEMEARDGLREGRASYLSTAVGPSVVLDRIVDGDGVGKDGGIGVKELESSTIRSRSEEV